MKKFSIVTVLIGGVWLAAAVPTANAAPCLIVTLTGTQGGPQSFNGLAGAGTLVRYGDDSSDCGAVKLQFDAGRGTTMRLSQLGVGPEQLNAVFFTHMHNDHTEGFADLVQLRWSFNGTGPKIDVVCSADAVSPLGVTLSCKKFTAHIADAFIQSGEVAQRHSELKERTAGGPAELINTITFEPTNEPQVVWSLGDLRVSAIRSTHTAGHASYRVDTPAGSVVIGGDAGNDVPAPPRSSSTSEQVEKLARGADIIVHSAIHPIMGPDKGSGMFPYAYLRQSSVSDLGAMAQRAGAKHLMLTHLIPPLGADQQYPFKVPGGPLAEADYRKAAQDGGFTGNIIVGTDLASLRFPAK
ncbi:MAG: MBL fold metallo-hydrolase [Xanthobacteraceae bacterium]